MKKKTFKSAFIATIPVLLGYLSIGTAFGLMLESIGYDYLWAGFMSLFVYSGSMQYISVELISRGAIIMDIIIITLLVNCRHMVYGFSLFEKLKGMGLRKLYIIFALTDETYALLSSATPPDDVDEKQYYFYIALLDHSYWILGGIIGATIGSLISINTQGVDFAMTALFVVICVEQWMTYPSKMPAILGAVCSVISLIVFGAENMLLPAMIGIIVVLMTNYIIVEKKKAD